jgi:hypothetical protein
MAVITGEIPAGTYRESIARVELFVDVSLPMDSWRLVIYFETAPYDAAGNLTGPATFGSRRVERLFGDINSDPEVVAMVATIKNKAYAYRDENIAAGLALAAAAKQRAADDASRLAAEPAPAPAE